MAKKQEVVEKEFTLDLSNIGKIAKKKPAAKPAVKKAVKAPKVKPSPKKEQQARVVAPKPPKAKPPVADTTDVKAKKHLRLVVSSAHIMEFETLFKRFVEETQTYWVNTSRVHIFVLGTLYLKQKYTRDKIYHQAPEEFITFISRKGNRLKSPEATLRKTDAKPLFFEMDPEIFQAYFSIIYSFLLNKDDVHNLSYSASYFFKDFINQLNGSFKAFCGFGRKNS